MTTQHRITCATGNDTVPPQRFTFADGRTQDEAEAAAKAVFGEGYIATVETRDDDGQDWRIVRS